MDILGIGPLEILFVLVIALIVLGPNEVIKTGKTIGRFLRKIVMSEEWQTFQQASNEIRRLPNRLIREAGLEDIQEFDKDIKKLTPYSFAQDINKAIAKEKKEIDEGLSAWTSPPASSTEKQPEPQSPKEEQNTETTKAE